VKPLNSLAEARIKGHGRLVATVLAGAWRRTPSPLEGTPDELAIATPLLLESGAGALGWWRVRDSALQSTHEASQLQDAYRLYTLKSVLHRRHVADATTLLREAGIEPVLVKGWAVARLYPEEGLRPYGDIDLCVRPDQYAAAGAVLNGERGRRYVVDLHQGFARLDDLSWEELYERSRVLKLGDAEVRVLAPEDHLRLLCVHMLRHGAWRPLWLCDIGAALEHRPAGFDWDRCLGRSRTRADWVASAVGLAHSLLGARVEDTPIAARARRLPSWLVANVLKNWAAPFPSLYAPNSFERPLITYLRRPAGIMRAVRQRWADPLEATIKVGGPVNGLPRFPFQAANLVWQALSFITKAPRLLEERKAVLLRLSSARLRTSKQAIDP
jgi:hypothetical protein